MSRYYLYEYNETGYVYDPFMTEHYNISNSDHVEKPDRIRAIMTHLTNTKTINKMKCIKSRFATIDELRLIHDKEYIDNIMSTSNMDDDDAEQFYFQYDDIYGNSNTADCARLAAGSTLELLSHIINDELDNGIAIVRPPGHHAFADNAMGFCFFNNVALAAIEARNRGMKVGVVDFDIHHGNGTQEILQDEHDILFYSVQRHDQGAFWPGTGEGTNNNIHNFAINGSHGTDEEYISIFEHNIIPLLDDYEPDIIIVSAGYDAAVNDPLGGFNVTPKGYAKIVSMMMDVQDKILLVLEGGYNLESLSKSVVSCVNVMLEH